MREEIVKPKGKCFAKICNECNWWRQDEREVLKDGLPTGVKEIVWICKFDLIFAGMHYHMGSLDGLQKAVNESNNKAIETKELVIGFSNAVVQILKNLPKQLRGNNDSKRLPGS